MAGRRKVQKETLPLFGVDSEEVELLRQLEKECRDFVEEGSKYAVLGFQEVLDQLTELRKKKRKN